MPIEELIDEIKSYASSASPIHAKSGFDQPRAVTDALEKVAETLAAIERRRKKTELNIAHRLGNILALAVDDDVIREALLDAEPNYPFGKDDPEQLEFDKAVDDAYRSALRANA